MNASLIVGVYMAFTGATVGSFLLVLGTRESYLDSLFGRSACTNCREILRVIDLIPILSYLLLCGRCQYCKCRLPIYYFIVEVLCGALFLLSWIIIGFQLELLVALLLISLLVLISITDLHRMLIPSSMLLGLAIPLLILRLIYLPSYEITSYFLVISLSVLIVLILSSWLNKLGGGDVKLFLLLMILFGIELLLFILLFSSLFTLVFAFIYIKKRRLAVESKIPFAPFISLATLLVYFYSIQF